MTKKRCWGRCCGSDELPPNLNCPGCFGDLPQGLLVTVSGVTGCNGLCDTRNGTFYLPFDPTYYACGWHIQSTSNPFGSPPPPPEPSLWGWEWTGSCENLNYYWQQGIFASIYLGFPWIPYDPEDTGHHIWLEIDDVLEPNLHVGSVSHWHGTWTDCRNINTDLELYDEPYYVAFGGLCDPDDVPCPYEEDVAGYHLCNFSGATVHVETVL